MAQTLADASHKPFLCRCCVAHCGMIAHLEGDRVVRVSGDPEHPISGGYSCAKGRAIPANHHSDRRLDRPRMAGRQVSWAECLDDIGHRLRGIVDARGVNAIAHYCGMGLYTDTLGWWALEKLFADLGSDQRYTTYTVDMATILRACELVIGFPFLPHWTPEDTDTTLAILIGTNPSISHGHSIVLSNPTHRLREYRKSGGELWVIDPRATKSASLADRHLAPQPGTDAFLLAWLIREMLIEGADEEELANHCRAEDVAQLRAAVAAFDLSVVADATGLAPSDMLDLLHAIRRHRRFAIVPGTGISFSPHAIVTDWLRLALLIVSGSLDRKGGMRFNVSGAMTMEEIVWSGHASADGSVPAGPRSRPELGTIVGQRPSVALVDEIEAGEVRALIVAGANPLAALPQPDRLRAALSKLDALILIDCFDSEMLQYATHILPSTWQLERSDVLLLSDRCQLTAPVLAAEEERKPGWWIMAELAERLGAPLLGKAGPREEVDVMRQMMAHARYPVEQLQAHGTHGVEVPRVHGWVHDKVLEEGFWRLVPGGLTERLAAAWAGREDGLRMISGRRMNSNNSAHYAEGETPAIGISADVAASHGLSDGMAVAVRSRAGRITGTVRIDRSLSVRTVWVPHGWADQNVNMLIDAQHVDPIHGQPVQSGFAVTLERFRSDQD